MKKIMKSMSMGLVGLLLCVGTVYAAYLVWSGTDNTTVQEPLSVEWVTTIPAKTYPNREYETKIRVHNVDVDGNGDQLVGVIATRSSGLVRNDICLDVIGDNHAPFCGYLFGQKMTFTLAKNGNAEVWAKVGVPSDADPVDEWVTFEVTRE